MAVAAGLVCGGAGCAQLQQRPTAATTPNVNAEIAQVEQRTTPIQAPIMLRVRPQGPVVLHRETTLHTGRKSVDASMQMSVSLVEAGESIRFEGNITRMTAAGTEVSCGTQPLLGLRVDVDRRWNARREWVDHTHGCAASEQQQTGDNEFATFILPSDGVATGDSLRRVRYVSPGESPAGDVRGIVAGMADWHGHSVVVLRLTGCTRAEVEKAPVSLCPHGVALIDIGSGLPIGALETVSANANGRPITITTRVYPS
ncbi:MAG TPA: hypothetical protein VIZ17_00870 [Acetobacteraceae bacterium]